MLLSIKKSYFTNVRDEHCIYRDEQNGYNDASHYMYIYTLLPTLLHQSWPLAMMRRRGLYRARVYIRVLALLKPCKIIIAV